MDSPNAIAKHFNNILDNIKKNSIPIWSSSVIQTPQLVTYAYLKVFLLEQVYALFVGLPRLAAVLTELERGNGDLLLQAAGINLGYNNQYSAGIPRAVISCSDGYGRGNISTLAGYREYAEFMINRSKYLGDVWHAKALDCMELDVQPPASWRFSGLSPYPHSIRSI